MPPAHAAPRLSTRREQGALRRPPRPSHANLSRVGKKKRVITFPCCWAVPRWRMPCDEPFRNMVWICLDPKKKTMAFALQHVTTMKIDNRDLHLNSRLMHGAALVCFM